MNTSKKPELLDTHCIREADDFFTLSADIDQALLEIPQSPEDSAYALGIAELREMARWCDAAANYLEDQSND